MNADSLLSRDCSKNAFCVTLPEATRNELCKHCRRSLIKAGSIQLYRDFERHSTLILDGIIMSSIHTGEDVLDYSEDVPTFYLGIPGRVLATNVTFRREDKMYYGSNGMEYLTDCCIATFGHSVIQELFNTNHDFAQSMALSMIRIMEDSCSMAALLRAETVFTSVHYMVSYLSRLHVYLSQQQIADILGRDRASVSKAIARLRKDNPALMDTYLQNKTRKVEMMNNLS